MPRDLTTVREFVAEVERRAEAMMLQTHKLEGMHYAAMKQVLQEWETELLDRPTGDK